MQRVFSTDGLHPRDSFNRWRETMEAFGVPLEQERLDDVPFKGELESTQVGPLLLTQVSHSALSSETTHGLIRRYGQDGSDGSLPVIFKVAGTSKRDQDGRTSIQRSGDLVVVDHRPARHITSAGSKSLYLKLPRARLESVLGPSQLYTALTIGSDLASTTLAITYFRELLRLHHQLSPDAADRMGSIGMDLIVASIAERMAKEVPRPLHGTVVVQRAKAFVEANIGDPTLDPPQLAVAVGVSLRRLQELFHERGRHISDWIWQRRLEVAAKRLSDPSCAHLPIGTLAYGCGFASQSHFSRRFKEHHGMSPREYRHATLVSRP